MVRAIKIYIGVILLTVIIAILATILIPTKQADESRYSSEEGSLGEFEVKESTIPYRVLENVKDDIIVLEDCLSGKIFRLDYSLVPEEIRVMPVDSRAEGFARELLYEKDEILLMANHVSLEGGSEDYTEVIEIMDSLLNIKVKENSIDNRVPFEKTVIGILDNYNGTGSQSDRNILYSDLLNKLDKEYNVYNVRIEDKENDSAEKNYIQSSTLVEGGKEVFVADINGTKIEIERNFKTKELELSESMIQELSTLLESHNYIHHQRRRSVFAGVTILFLPPREISEEESKEHENSVTKFLEDNSLINFKILGHKGVICDKET